MKTYDELVRGYRRRQYDTAMDVTAAGLTCADEIATGAGVVIGDAALEEMIDAAGMALPFVVIAVTEGARVLKRRKPAATGLQDGIARMAKTTVSLGAGSAAAAAVGAWAAMPVILGMRLTLDCCRSRLMTERRVQGRINRLRALNDDMTRQAAGNLPESVLQERIPGEVVEM